MKGSAKREEREENIKIDRGVLKTGLGNRRRNIKEQEQCAKKRGENERVGERRGELREERG